MTETDKIESLLRDLAGSFIAYPKELKVTAQKAEDGESTFWAMKPHPNDESKLVGKGGCHVRALSFIVRSLGLSRGEIWTFRLITLDLGMDPFQKRKYALEFDPKPHCDLLRRVMVAYKIPCTVSVGPGQGERNQLSYVLKITVMDGEFDFFGVLTKSITPKTHNEETVEKALDTIFRAIGRFHGVEFKTKVIKL